MNQKKNLLKPILGIGLFIVIAVLMLFAYTQLKQKPENGSKKIVVEVVVPNEEAKDFTIQTDAEYLRQALQEENLIAGAESEYGFFITEVNGRVANDDNQEWWCITKNGEDVFTGVNETVIYDGDHYELTLTVGYE